VTLYAPKQGVELPSDYYGIVYLKMDEAGAWKHDLKQELMEAKILTDLPGAGRWLTSASSSCTARFGNKSTQDRQPSAAAQRSR